MPDQSPAYVIWWIRRDLRIHENTALAEASRTGGRVLPLFILDPALLVSSYASAKRLAFMYGGLRCLDQDLRRLGSRLIVREGDPLSALLALIGETGANAIYAEADYSPYARRRDRRVAAALPLYLVGSTAIHPPGSILKSDGNPYTIYTPFSKSWKALFIPKPELPVRSLSQIPEEITGLPLPDFPQLPNSIPIPAGEKHALERLAAFSQSEANGIFAYNERRNRMDLDGTSQLSPYLRFGMLSPRLPARAALQAIQRAPTAQALHSAETWLNEIVWRDFYIHILHHFPHVRVENFRNIPVRWRNDPGEFSRWKNAETGYPVVDAAMRQLIATGWMHNRARMIAASFLTKDLLIDWRWGEHWFMQHLIDGDPAANNGGWQWTAGTGTDAAPYFRVFNPVLQSMKFDPQGEYIRHWLPELASVPVEHIHAPWRMSQSLQLSLDIKIGREYPSPLVDHEYARQRALAFYKT